MRGILLDENLPASLSFPSDLPQDHVSSLGSSPADSRIWQHAQTFDLVIVTKDADFSFRIAMESPPPRVVHLRIGNMRLRELKAVCARFWPRIEAHLKSAKLVNVYENRIEVVG